MFSLWSLGSLLPNWLPFLTARLLFAKNDLGVGADLRPGETKSWQFQLYTIIMKPSGIPGGYHYYIGGRDHV